ncbi:hypothetical protein PINS_up012548 [Pythium insidiosum]|nr:hypothetical protein PINS_up012548 [Pythium insidiosum]
MPELDDWMSNLDTDLLQLASSLELPEIISPEQYRPPSIGIPLRRSDSAPSPGTKLTRSNRPRQEIIHLRSKVQELEALLAGLQSKTLGGESPTVNRADRPPPQLWAAVAMHQLQQRHQAELENARLRVLVRDQVRVSQTIELLLRRQGDVEVRGDNVHSSTTSSRRYH